MVFLIVTVCMVTMRLSFAIKDGAIIAGQMRPIDSGDDLVEISDPY